MDNKIIITPHLCFFMALLLLLQFNPRLPTFPSPLVLAESKAPSACSRYSLSKWSCCAWIRLQPNKHCFNKESLDGKCFYKQDKNFKFYTYTGYYWM